MASRNLGQFVSGFLNPKGNLGDFQHAARLFVDNDMALAPKAKFNFFVTFNIDERARKSVNQSERHRNEVNMLVKSIDLPSYTVDTVTANQYNRKKGIQTKISYNPLNITFHDDNIGVIRQLWKDYYNYYYADPASAKNYDPNFHRTATSKFLNTDYGFDSHSSVPFFKNITIYHMAKKYWQSYVLINPLIREWKQSQLDHSRGGELAEHIMGIQYEAVTFSEGQVTQQSPGQGFGIEHYDTVPSPISLPGGGSRSLLGEGGVLAGISTVIGDIGQMVTGDQPLTMSQILSTAAVAANTYNNAKQLKKSDVKGELIRDVVSGGSKIVKTVSGVTDAVFPIKDVTTGIKATLGLR